MSGSVKALLQKYQKRISAITGRWLKEIILYGSYARGDFRKDSDTDIMPIVKSARQFNYWKKAYMFYRNVDQEGVKL